MFDNIGSKIKGLAKVCAGICIFLGVVLALVGLFNESLGEMLGWIIFAIIGVICAWPLYGFGELIELVSQIAANTSKQNQKNTVATGLTDYLEMDKNVTSDKVEKEWICNKCGKHNSVYLITCMCGNVKE